MSSVNLNRVCFHVFQAKLFSNPLLVNNNKHTISRPTRNYFNVNGSIYCHFDHNNYQYKRLKAAVQNAVVVKHKTKNLAQPCMRAYRMIHSEQHKQPVEVELSPLSLIDDDVKHVMQNIKDLIQSETNQPELGKIAKYYFDKGGKTFRSMMVMLMARSVNYHIHKDMRGPSEQQIRIAMISEMLHSASLFHDDLIDQSDFRRGKPSAYVLWNHRKVTMTGNFILAISVMLTARLKNDEVAISFAKIIKDLVQGEMMQLGSKSKEERFAYYISKTYKKTASLIANTTKSAALVSGADESLVNIAFQYGRNVGLAYQLVDDLLDFVSSSEVLGKPSAVDLKLGLATAPVLFACEKFPELESMIVRRFQKPGDVKRAIEFVHEARGLEQTRTLVEKHCEEAVRYAQQLSKSPYQNGLVDLIDFVIKRTK